MQSNYIQKKDLTALLIVMGFNPIRRSKYYSEDHIILYSKGHVAVNLERFDGITVQSEESKRGRSFVKHDNGFDRVGILEYINHITKEYKDEPA